MNPEQWLSLKWNGGSTMSDRWLNQSKIIQMFGKSGIDYLDDESVAWMDENYDATPQTIMLESIRDDIFCQTN